MSNVKELNINSTTYDIIGKGVVDQNNTSNAIKTWSGTRAQYNAITTKDSNTLYNITDDATTQLSAHNLFDFKWVDHELNDQSWLRADTFSWQDGTVYSDAYNHLVADYNGGTTQSETIGSYTISYKLASDGHKITTDETNAANIYNATGVAWYYILDTANQRFKLPRTKWGVVGIRDTVGKYVPETLPDHRHSMSITLRTDLGAGGKSAYTNGGTLYTTYASASNSTYQDGAPVQQRATQMYLYFYVGQFSQSATEQTAGLNAELFNEKVDLDSSWGFPSSSYYNLTLGATGTSYTAPDNGYVFVSKQATAASQYVSLESDRLQTIARSTASSQAIYCYIPVKKGGSFRCWYNAGGDTNSFRFVYAQKTN